MSSQLQLDESVRSNSYARFNNLYHCKKCDVQVLFSELAEHVAKKHRNLRFDSDISSTVTDSNVSLRIASAKSVEPTTYSMAGQKCAVAQSSGDETEFLTFKPNQALNSGTTSANLFDDSGVVSTSTPNLRDTTHKSRSVRSLANKNPNAVNGSTLDQMNDGDAAKMVQNRRKTAMELFDLDRHQMASEPPKTANGNGGDGGGNSSHAKRKRSTFRRRTISTQRASVIPDNFVPCQFCSNTMHQDYLHAHIERKHRQCATVFDDSTVNVVVNGINSIAIEPKTVDARAQTGIANGTIAGIDVNGAKIKENKETIQCTFCSANMHVHYMPLHLVRKHRTEFDGSVGFFWTQCTDDQMNKLLNANRVFVKNGAFFIANSK